MKPVEKIEEGCRKALAYNPATQVVVHGFGDKDIHLIGTSRKTALLGVHWVYMYL